MHTPLLLSTDETCLILHALTQIKGLGANTAMRLLREAETPQGLWDASDNFLNKHLSAMQREAFLKRRDQSLDHAWLETHRKAGITLLPYTDPAYPPLLQEIYNAPPLLYFQGNVSILNSKTLAIVGTRKATEYGKQVLQKFIADLQPSGVTIVSGLAAGIDTYAHGGALQHKLPTVAVFGCGLDIIYPTANRRLSRDILEQGGVLVSEYPLGSPPTQYTFPQRNRIVAGLSHGVLVIEGDIKSGALITARIGLEEGRSIFAVPGNIFNAGSQGPLYLIRSGAIPVGSGDDILNELNWQSESASSAQSTAASSNFELKAEGNRVQPEIFESLSEDEQALLRIIPFEPTSLDTLQKNLGWPSSKINETLTLLELESLIVLLPGSKVARL